MPYPNAASGVWLPGACTPPNFVPLACRFKPRRHFCVLSHHTTIIIAFLSIVQSWKTPSRPGYPCHRHQYGILKLPNVACVSVTVIGSEDTCPLRSRCGALKSICRLFDCLDQRKEYVKSLRTTTRGSRWLTTIYTVRLELMASIELASYELGVPPSVVAVTDPRVRVPCPGTPISTKYNSMSKQVNYSIPRYQSTCAARGVDEDWSERN